LQESLSGYPKRKFTVGAERCINDYHHFIELR